MKIVIVVCEECGRHCSSDDMNPNICEACGHVDASHKRLEVNTENGTLNKFKCQKSIVC